MKKEGILRRCCRSRPVQYLNNILEQDHRAIKRRVKAKQGFREFRAARRAIQGYEAMHMIRKGQARGVSGRMFGDRFSSSTSCSRWLHETEPGRPNQSLSCCFLKVATHPSIGLGGLACCAPLCLRPIVISGWLAGSPKIILYGADLLAGSGWSHILVRFAPPKLHLPDMVQDPLNTAAISLT